MTDAVVVGAGAGGLTVAIGLAGLGRRVALVERDRVGGECAATGCIPSKTLIHLAGDPSLRDDPRALLARVRAVRDGVLARDERELATAAGITILRGEGVLRGPGRVAVGDREVAARHVVLAAGADPRVLEVPGLPAGRTLTSASLFELDEPPASLAVIGGGAIGLEMACAFARLGTRVTLVEAADALLAGVRPEVSPLVVAALRERGIDVRLGGRASGYADGRLHVGGSDGEAEVPAERVLMAVGRTPRVEVAGGLVRAGADGIAVDDWGRTSVPRVWAVGDVTPIAHETHAANAFGRRVVQRIGLPWLPALGRRPVIPSAVFADPEVAWVGLSRAELARGCAPGALMHIAIDVPRTDRGITDGVRHGVLWVDAVRLTGRIAGATVIGPRASEVIAPLTVAVARGISLLRLQRLVWAYPTYAAALGAAADEFARRTLPRLGPEARAYARHRFARPPGRTR